jgi:hypothetical protein
VNTIKEINMYSAGDIVSVTFRDGVKKNGEPDIKTIERAEVLGCEGDYLKIAYRNMPPDGSVEYIELDFNMKSAELILAQCIR